MQYQNEDDLNMSSKKKETINYLTLVPVQKVTEFKEVEGTITLLVPKFKNTKFSNWFIPKRKSQYINIHLDEQGSQVWRLINGQRQVHEICSVLSEFLVNQNKPNAQIEERVTKFLSDLLKKGFIDLNEVQSQSNV